jgi:hypothetical protein
MKKLSLVPIVLCVLAFAGCSNSTPLSPTPPAAGGASELSVKPSAGTPGVYTLAFVAHVDGTLQEVTSLPVGAAELILKASVTSSTGTAAQAGTVTFEYCSYKGRPPNDITRADEAPKEACEQGTASWARLTSMSVYPGTCPTLGPGNACMNFGVVRIPRDVGFRFRYAEQRSGIASGTSQAKNFTWTSVNPIGGS